MTESVQPIIVALALSALSGLTCGPRPADAPDQTDDPPPPTTALRDSQPTSLDTASATARIVITGPTVIVAFPRPEPGDSSHDSFEAYGDWFFYAGQAATFLDARGVRAVRVVVDTLRITHDGKETVLPVPRDAPLCYFATPGHRPHHVTGFDSHGDIIDVAAQYFWAGKVPLAAGDTLTPETANADFVITRSTVIAFFSRRALRRFYGDPPEYPDSARLAQQVEYVRDSLDHSGITIAVTFKEPFTVFLRGAVDTMRPIQSGGVIGYYVADPDDWARRRLWMGLRSTSSLVRDIGEYVDRLRSTVRRDSLR